MEEKPILFSTEMVRAVLDGRKTQTRRTVKPQPEKHHWEAVKGYKQEAKLSECQDGLKVKFKDTIKGASDTPLWVKCPYGEVGDKLWVRETWQSNKEKTKFIYKADYEGRGGFVCNDDILTGWRPSIHMPRKASRLALEIVDIRVERVQDITGEDARAEGMSNDDDPYWRPSYNDPDSGGCPSYRNSFEFTWDSIYKNWGDNPWVWVVEFNLT